MEVLNGSDLRRVQRGVEAREVTRRHWTRGAGGRGTGGYPVPVSRGGRGTRGHPVAAAGTSDSGGAVVVVAVFLDRSTCPAGAGGRLLSNW